jgi:glycine/D-amino acid oxidase-like deaminating enzyme
MNSTDFDVVIVGARCAGASTARLLARHGQRVLLVDRAKLPSEIAHGHFIHRHGPRRLQHWGVLERIVASGCPPVSMVTIDLGDFPLQARDLWLDGVAWGYGPRRGVLDAIMLDAAIEAGVEVHDEFGNVGLSGVRSLDEALASYELRRNDATLPDFHDNLQAARLEPCPPDVLELRAALRGHPADIKLFTMASRDMIPREAFFNSENLARIMARPRTAA